MNGVDNFATILQSFGTQTTQANAAHQRPAKQGESSSFRELMQQKQPSSRAQAAREAADNSPPDAIAAPETPLPDSDSVISSLELAAPPLPASPLISSSDLQMSTQNALPFAPQAMQLAGQLTAQQQAAASPSEAQEPLLPQAQQLQQVIPEEQKPLTAPLQPEQAAPKAAPMQTPTAAGQLTSESGANTPAARQTAQISGQGEVIVKESEEAPAQPLFRQLEGAPLKVANPQTLDAESPDFTHQLSKKVDTALQNGQQKIEINLNPAHLGKLTIELTRTADGSLRMVLFTATERAASLLSEHAGSLTSLLRGNVQASVQVEIQQQQQGERDGHPQPQHGQQEQQQQREKQQTQDFLEQLRLSIIPFEGEAS